MTITAVNGSSSAVSDGSTTNDATLTVTFTSSAATTNFTVGDVTVSGGDLVPLVEVVQPTQQRLPNSRWSNHD